MCTVTEALHIARPVTVTDGMGVHQKRGWGGTSTLLIPDIQGPRDHIHPLHPPYIRLQLHTPCTCTLLIPQMNASPVTG